MQTASKFSRELVGEHALLAELAAEPAVVNALELIHVDTTLALVMEDGGDSLASLIGQHASSLSSQSRRSSSPNAPVSTTDRSSSPIVGGDDFASLSRRLEVAVAIAAALERIHARGIIHLDVKPHNVLVDPVTKRVTLCDFGSTIRLVSGSGSPALGKRASKSSAGSVGGSARMVGSPAYMAPEQTGRTTGALDARTDLYGFGVLLYQLFTFRLPFECATAAEYIQAHLARTPLPPRRVMPSLPVAIDSVIMKLLNKDKELRYGSAHGAKVDLEHCLAELNATGTIPDTLLLGARDRSGALRAPQQLWGREPELARLVAVMAAARAGGRVCALVDGPSGVGKSALIEEARRCLNDAHQHTTLPATAKPLPTTGMTTRVIIATGKGEQARRVPYSTLDQAVAQLVASLQMEGHHAMNAISEALRASLGTDASVLAAALPSAQPLLGVTENITLDGEHAHARFSSALQRFFHCVTTAESKRTCILVVDDIQWCEESTLRSLEDLLCSDQLTHFMVLCAYRTNEIPAPLLKLLTSAEGFAQATTITVKGLVVEDVAGLIGDVLDSSAQAVHDLATVCSERTSGNPLHVMEILRFLHAGRLLSFDRVEGAFKWDIKAVRSKVTSTPDVAEMVLQRMGATLSGDAATVLLCGALLGAQFSSEVVQQATGLTVETVQAALQAAVAEGIVEHYFGPTNVTLPASTAPDGERTSSLDAISSDKSFRFLHDKIHEAASKLQPEKCPQLRVSLGLLLLRQFQSLDDTSPRRGKLVFEICDHLNAALASGAPVDEDVVTQLVSFNMEAAKASHQLMAFAASKRYIETAREHLQRRALAAKQEADTSAAEDAMWAFDYNTALKLTVERISIAQQMDEDDVANEAVQSGINHARTLTDKGKMLVSKVYMSITKVRLMEGLDAMKQALEYMGRPLPTANLAEFTQGLIEKHHLNDLTRLDRLVDLELADDEYMDVIASVLGGGMIVAFLTDPPTFGAVCALAWDLVLEHGVNARFCGPLAMYCALLVARGEYQAADRISTSVRALIRKLNFRTSITEPLVLIMGLVHAWARPLKDAHPLFAEAVKLGLEVGDYNFVGYAHLHESWFYFVEGRHLGAVARGLPELIAFARSVKNTGTLPALRALMRVCAKLMRERFTTVLREHGESTIIEDEAEYEKSLSGAMYAEWSYLVLMGFYHVIMDRPADAIEYLDKAEPKTIVGLILVVVSHFLQIMAHARLHGTSISAETLTKLDAYRAKIAKCAESAPFNWGSILALVDAELMRVRGAPTSAVISALAAMIAQESAPTAMRCPWLLGLAHETAARTWENEAMLPYDYREFHLRSAIAAYRDWGAFAKAERVRRAPHVTHTGAHQRSVDVTPPIELPVLAPNGSPSSHARVGNTFAGEGTASVTADVTTNTTDLDALFLLKGFQLISAELRADRVYDVALPVLAESSGAQHAMIVTLSEQGNPVLTAKFSENLHTAGSVLPPYMSLEVGARLTDKEALLSLLHVTAKTREPHIVEDAMKNAEYWNQPYVLQSKARSIICAPILTRGNLTAVLYMENNLYPSSFSKRQVTFVTILLNQVSISVENAHLYARIEEDTRSLHGTVATRDGEIHNARAEIKTAREGAALANHAQSAWLATMVHELRTPISSVISLAQQLLATPVSPEQRENLEIIRSSSDNLVKQVDDILVSSQREQPKLIFAPEPTDLRRCLTDCSLVVRVQAAAKQLKLETELDDDLPAVVIIDALRVRQIVINLLGNAVKFTDQGAVTLRMSARQVPPPSATRTAYGALKVSPKAPWYELHCQVTDTGAGISSEGISRLFTAFEQVDSSSEKKLMGTGLGLAISKNLTDLMGGRIWVESTVNRGSTFHFTFVCPGLEPDASPITPATPSGTPQVVGAKQSAPSSPVSSRAASAVEGTDPPLKVLVVDDSPINLKILQKLLALASKQNVTTLAGSGEEALLAVRKSFDQPFDVIFMDVHMSGMDGAAVACAIRAMDLPAQPRIFAFTADVTFEEEETAKCFDAVLLKPLMLTDLMAALRTPRPVPHA